MVILHYHDGQPSESMVDTSDLRRIGYVLEPLDILILLHPGWAEGMVRFRSKGLPLGPDLGARQPPDLPPFSLEHAGPIKRVQREKLPL
jgi:hypothetical protein